MDERTDHGVPVILGTLHRSVDWTERIIPASVPKPDRLAVAEEATSRISITRRRDLSFTDGEGDWQCVCQPAGDDE